MSHDTEPVPGKAAAGVRSAQRFRWSIIVILAALSVASLAVWFLRPPPRPPADLDALEAGVQPVGLTPVRVGRYAVYLCDHPRDLAVLYSLMRTREAASQWVGVVYADYAPPIDALDDATTHDWGSNGLRIGDWILFGDPALLTKIRERFR